MLKTRTVLIPELTKPSMEQAVSNASEMFLSEQLLDSEILAGLAVAVIMDGSRTFLIEIQVFAFVLSLYYIF